MPVWNSGLNFSSVRVFCNCGVYLTQVTSSLIDLALAQPHRENKHWLWRKSVKLTFIGLGDGLSHIRWPTSTKTNVFSIRPTKPKQSINIVLFKPGWRQYQKEQFQERFNILNKTCNTDYILHCIKMAELPAYDATFVFVEMKISFWRTFR